jgi:hypothetical protein
LPLNSHLHGPYLCGQCRDALASCVLIPSVRISLSHTHTHTIPSVIRALSLYLSLSHTYTHTLSLSHTHTHSLTHSLTHSHYVSMFLSLSLSRMCPDRRSTTHRVQPEGVRGSHGVKPLSSRPERSQGAYFRALFVCAVDACSRVWGSGVGFRV